MSKKDEIVDEWEQPMTCPIDLTELELCDACQ